MKMQCWLVLTAVAATAGLSLPAEAARSITMPTAGITHPYSPMTDQYATGGVLTYESGDTVVTVTITRGGAGLATSWQLYTLDANSYTYNALAYPTHAGGNIVVTTKAVLRDGSNMEFTVQSGGTTITH